MNPNFRHPKEEKKLSKPSKKRKSCIQLSILRDFPEREIVNRSILDDINPESDINSDSDIIM